MTRRLLQFFLTLTTIALFAGRLQAAGLTAAPRPFLFAGIRPEYVQADTDGNKLFDDLEAELATAPADRRWEVIVRCRPGHEAASLPIAEHITRSLPLDHSVVARLTAAEVYQLAASDAVESIEENELCQTSRRPSQTGYGVTKARSDFGLTGDGDGEPNSYSARDHTIAIIDTGIDGGHPDFADGSKIIGWRDLINNRSTPYDDNGHGTWVASIAAGAVVNGVGGVAPGAALVGVKVVDAEGFTGDAVIAQGIDWCVQNRQQYGIEVINVSLNLVERKSGDGTDVVSRAVDRAVAAGIVVCHAAGNTGPDLSTIAGGASAKGAITVGNMVDPSRGGFVLYKDSSRGPTADGRVKPDLCAPGYQILAARWNSNGYIRHDGTSASTPFVAGVVALVRQVKPTLTPDQIKTLLKTTAVHWGPQAQGTAAPENNDFGAGRLDGYAALAAARETRGTPPSVPRHIYREGSLTTAGTEQAWDVPITDTSFPFAVTLLLNDAVTDFELSILGPDGKQIASSRGNQRQLAVALAPSSTGTYRVVVTDRFGKSSFSLDISAGTSLQ